jgi:hypothetical protein
LINVTVNETVDQESRTRKRDRQGLNMAVSCLGVTVGQTWHSEWTDDPHAVQQTGKVPTGLRPVGGPYGTDHPLVDELGRHADQAEMLSLREWVGTSGAAFDPGAGRTINLGTALLMGLVNLRTGHWWDSGISEAARVGFPATSLLRRVIYLMPRYFATQSLLIFEWLARYPGPWERFWHLSDGGLFENLAGYELVRRRVPRIILCDSTADPDYQFSDFAEFVRKVRIDFNAHISPFSVTEIKQHVPALLQKHLGTLNDLKPVAGGPRIVAKHAALFWIDYPDDPSGRRSVLLFFKASQTGDESVVIQSYHETHTDFPHESTADQFFDEAQWECYRELGEHMGMSAFAGSWFWRIPVSAV